MKIKQIVNRSILSVLLAVTILVPAVPVAALDCAILPESICGAAEQKDLEQSGTWKLVLLVMEIMSVGVGVVAVGSIAYAGFLYTTAKDSRDQTQKAKDMILNTVIGIVAFALMYVILQFLIPGGVFFEGGS